jgi:sugar lactone lactonase YvrE
MNLGGRTPVSTMLGAPARAHAAARADGSPQPQVAPPQFSVAPGAYSSAQSVTITCSTQGAIIYYTTNGNSAYTAYSGTPVAISRSMTLLAYATASSGSDSPLTFGNYYITSVPDSFVYDVAGTNFFGLAGDGGLATEADINTPVGVTLDKSGNIFFADSGNNDVREISASTGVITTVAGTGISGYSGDNGSATSAQLSHPSSVAFDGSGNLYVADLGNGVIRKIDLSAGTISTYAGNPTAMSLGDNGPAIDAETFSPYAIAFDAAGNLYIEASGRIREVNANTQIITTVAGGGNPPNEYGDGGLAINAYLSAAQGLALDISGNIYIADTYNNAVRKVTRSTGIINTIAGTIGIVNAGFSGDGGPAASAKLSAPTAITLDGSGNLYISDSYNDRIRRVDATTGIISTVEGHGFCLPSVGENGGVAANAGVCFPGGLAFDSNGKLYYSDTAYGTVKVVTAAGTPPNAPTATPVFSVAAGTYATPQTLTLTDPTPGATIYLQVDPAPQAEIPNESTQFTSGRAYNGPIDVAGNVTVRATAVAPGHMPSPTVSSTYTITAPPTSVITTVAGNGNYGSSGIGGPATEAQLGILSAIAFDSNGDLYMADCNNEVVWGVASGSGILSIFAGTGTYNRFWNPGPATSAPLACPSGVAVDQSGNVFISDNNANEVLEVLASNGNISLYAGGGEPSAIGSGDGGPATSASVPSPGALAVDNKGDLYIIEGDYTVREVTAATGIINTVAGGNIDVLGDGGPATSASLYVPDGVALDSSGNLYIADSGHGRVRMVNAQTGIITTVAGDGDQGESGDGLLATEAEVSPQNIAVDSHGNLYFVNFSDHIRKVDATTGIISSVAGSGSFGYSGDGGSPLVATICPGSGLTLDPSGNLYFTDSCGYAVRKVTLPSGLLTTPTITWTAPAQISYGTALSAAQLNATASVSGAFAYSPAAGTVLGAGSQSLKATFTPTDAASYATATASVTLIVNTAAPTIALTSSANPADSQQAITFTAAVASAVGMPTGSVTFWNGNTQLGSATLTNGSATFTNAFIAGGYLITAQYSGDADFASVVSSSLTQNVNPFLLVPASGGSTSSTVSPGGTATYKLSVTPPGNNPVQFSVTGLPAGATSTFSPGSVPAGAAATTVTLSVVVSSQSAAVAPASPARPSRMPLALGFALLPLLALRRLRKGYPFLLIFVLAIAGVAGLATFSGCGGGGSNSGGGGGPQAQTYNLTVTANAGSQTVSIPLTLTVQ